MRILVVDDDRALLRALTIGLRAQGYDVLPAADGRSALDACREDEPDLMILDLGLPDLSGLQVLRELREWSQLPVIVLSARSGSRDKVTALDLGADDYVTKPFSVEELLARIRAAARHAQVVPETITTAAFSIDLAARRATRDGAAVRLTPREWALLEALVRSPGQLVSQRDLLREIWGPHHDDRTNYLRVFMATLRKKLEPDPAHPRYLVTEPGMGYRYEPETGQSGG
jgi:two-component system, OmpR family, KDP operon response regulator KdpE